MTCWATRPTSSGWPTSGSGAAPSIGCSAVASGWTPSGRCPWTTGGCCGSSRRAVPEFNEAGRVDHVLVMNTDITALKRTEAELAHQALHDPLTGLANRALLLDQLSRILARRQRVAQAVALLFLDLDRFKVVNDSLGHIAGDQLLVQTAKRLASALRPTDTVARLGGDEFVVLIDDFTDPQDPHRAGRAHPPGAQGPRAGRRQRGVHHRAASASPWPTHPTTPPTACCATPTRPCTWPRPGAATATRSSTRICAPRPPSGCRPSRTCAERSRWARSRSTTSPSWPSTPASWSAPRPWRAGTTRWPGCSRPGSFIELAEDSGLILELGEWVLTEACRQAGEWQRERPDSP